MESTQQKTMFTVREFSKIETAFSEAAIRALIFSDNGLTKCGAIFRVGRRVLIHRERFMQWLISGGAH